VTRENKLALIVGFSVILVVGVLVSDHFSKARQDRLRDLDEQEIGSVGMDRSRGFVPSEPLTSNDATPIAARSQPTEQLLQNTPWSSPRSTGNGLLGDALQGRSQQSNRSAEAQRETPKPSIADSDRVSFKDSPLLIEQGQSSGSGGALASRDSSYDRLIGNALDRDVLIPLTSRATVATGGPRVIDERSTRATQPWEYHVRKDDSLYSIAEELLGSGRRWREIRDLNKDRLNNGSVLRIGIRLRMPVDARNPTRIDATPRRISEPAPQTDRKTDRKTEPKVSPKAGTTEYTIESGDSLSQISQQLLGTVKRMDEIVRLNKDKISNADEIREGMTLRIPAR